MRLGLGLG